MQRTTPILWRSYTVRRGEERRGEERREKIETTRREMSVVDTGLTGRHHGDKSTLDSLLVAWLPRVTLFRMVLSK